MIIFLYGQDIYRSRQKLNEIIEHYKKIHQSGLNLKYFDFTGSLLLEQKKGIYRAGGKKLIYLNFEDEFRHTPMFKEKKLVILKNIFLNQEFKNSFLKNVKKYVSSNDIILFYEEGEVFRNDPLFKFLEKNVKTQNFELLEGQRLKNWVKKELGRYKAESAPQAIEKLINFAGNDLWQLSNEVKKLVSFKSGKKIESEDIELLMKPKIETDIFKTIDAIAQKDKKRALLLIHKHLGKGDSPLYLLSMINFQFRNLLMIKDLIEKNRPYYAISKMTKLHPFVVKKSWQLANKFTFQELKKIYQKIFQADLNIKTGKIDPQAALDLFIAEI